MLLDKLELPKRLTIVFVDVMGASSHLLKPHCLVIMDANIVATILHKDVHDVATLINFAFFQGEHGRDGVNSAISLVEAPGLFMERCGSVSIA